jgi:hypothetical protein
MNLYFPTILTILIILGVIFLQENSWWLESKFKSELRKATLQDYPITLRIYMCPVTGIKKFGINHRITLQDPEFSLPPGSQISQSRIDSAFNTDLRTSIQLQREFWGAQNWNSLPQPLKIVLASIMFDLNNDSRLYQAEFSFFNGYILLNRFKKAAAKLSSSELFQSNLIPKKRLDRLINTILSLK